jgi:acetyl-CoA synthetase
MNKQQIYPVNAASTQDSLIDNRQYQAMYQLSIEQPERFWAEQGNCIDWIKPFSEVQDYSFGKQDLHIKWYRDGYLNVTANCLDRHLAAMGDKAALIWEPDDPDESHQQLSYRELYGAVCRCANGLKDLGVVKGDVVTIYLPLIPETVISMLACARIGAVHSVVFGGFSAQALADRIEDSQSRWVITADHSLRAGQQISLKDNVDVALNLCTSNSIDKVVVVRRSGLATRWNAQRDLWYHEMLVGQPEHCVAAVMAADDPLFILYTAGSAGKPCGLVHACGGYLVYAATTHQYVFDCQPEDIYWCTADIGWMTGHSYVVYGPLANGATTLLHEGVPDYPDIGRWAQLIDKYKVSIFYTAPTVVRSLMAYGKAAVRDTDRDSLRLLGLVGEPISPDAWRWFYHVFGRGVCPVIDTWWQSETGGIMIAPLPGATALKPGSATLPFFGVEPALFDNAGRLVEGPGEGKLVIRGSWPGQACGVFGDPEGFYQAYFASCPGYYFTGDGARRDEDGYYWLTGRVDEVVNVAGHRLSSAEIEKALLSHCSVLEAAVVAYPHAIKGQGLYVFVSLRPDQVADEHCRQELVDWLRSQIGGIAKPDLIQWVSSLPRTCSGEIARGVLRKIAYDDCDQLGDTSNLAEPEALQQLIDNRIRRSTSA